MRAGMHASQTGVCCMRTGQSLRLHSHRCPSLPLPRHLEIRHLPNLTRIRQSRRCHHWSAQSRPSGAPAAPRRRACWRTARCAEGRSCFWHHQSRPCPWCLQICVPCAVAAPCPAPRSMSAWRASNPGFPHGPSGLQNCASLKKLSIISNVRQRTWTEQSART